MKIDFIFFRNSAVRQEIYKHKWIESEKAGREIGFATAAFDWMSKHYTGWASTSQSSKSPHRRELALNR